MRRETLMEKLLTAAGRCVDEALDSPTGYERNLQGDATHTFVAAYEKLARLNSDEAQPRAPRSGVAGPGGGVN